MRPWTVVSIWYVMAAPIACAPAGTAPPAPRAKVVADTIRALMAAYMTGLQEQDFNRMTNLFAKEPDFRVYVGDQVLTYDSMLASAAQARTTRLKLQAAWDTLEVSVLRDDAAIAAGRFWQIATDSLGVAEQVRGTATWVWVRRPVGWRVIHIHATTYPVTSP